MLAGHCGPVYLLMCYLQTQTRAHISFLMILVLTKHTQSTAQIRSHGDSTISLIFMKLNHCYNMDLEVCVLSMRKALSLSPYTRKKNTPKWERWIRCRPECVVLLLLFVNFLMAFLSESTSRVVQPLCTWSCEQRLGSGVPLSVSSHQAVAALTMWASSGQESAFHMDPVLLSEK